MSETIKAGQIDFMIENRFAGQERDGGPSMQVLADVEGTRVQVLRFDMFRIQPHYHYAPTGMNTRYDLDPLTVEDGIGWVIGLLNKKLPALAAKAGYEKVADPATVEAAQQALPDIEKRWRAMA